MLHKIKDITKIMEQIAPTSLAEDWDNVGLLLGDNEHIVGRIMVSLDITHELILEAIEKKVDLIISHHPMFFKPISSIKSDDEYGKKIYPLIKNNISVYSAHTNLDKAFGGTDDTLARTIGLKEISVLVPETQEYFKLVLYIPEGYEERIINVLGPIGVGSIGEYSHCTFRTSGIGTFKPLEKSNPFIGEKGKISEVSEIKLETIISSKKIHDTLNAVKAVHPYEEMAYDMYPLANEFINGGIGRIGRLNTRTQLSLFLNDIKKSLSTDYLYLIGNGNDYIDRVAVCGGAGGDYIGYAHMQGADVFITGEIKYHYALEAREKGINVICAGHYATERPVVDELIKRLQMYCNDLQYNIDIIPCESQKDPISIVKE